MDPVALNLFLRFRYTPSPLTIFQGIRKLAPGTMLVVERREMPRRALVQLHASSISEPKEDKEATDELLELYRAARETPSAERRSGRNPS